MNLRFVLPDVIVSLKISVHCGRCLQDRERSRWSVLEASKQLGVTRARVNQLLRQRRAGDPDPLTTSMIAKLDTPRGRNTYKKRAASIEPVFAQIKHNRKIRDLSWRGLAAVDSEWKLICATHNLMKLYRLAWQVQADRGPNTPQQA